MAGKFTLNVPAGQPADRQLYLVYGNTGTYSSPEWHVIGKRVENSSAENDFGEESKTDILGDTYSTMKKPVITQDFDPCEVDSGDEYQEKLIQLFVVEQNVGALQNQDLLRVHLYLTDAGGNAFAERYPSSMVRPTSLGGDGGGALTMPISVTFGGTRETGSVTPPVKNGGTVTFSAGD